MVSTRGVPYNAKLCSISGLLLGFTIFEGGGIVKFVVKAETISDLYLWSVRIFHPSLEILDGIILFGGLGSLYTGGNLEYRYDDKLKLSCVELCETFIVD